MVWSVVFSKYKKLWVLYLEAKLPLSTKYCKSYSFILVHKRHKNVTTPSKNSTRRTNLTGLASVEADSVGC